MKVHAIQKNARMSPRKIRPLARLMRGLPAEQALHQLSSMPGKAPEIIGAVLRSAMANAVHNLNAKEDTLTVSEVLVNEGLVMKRHQPVAKGMAHPILKRTAHVTVVVEGQDVKKKKAAAKKKPAIKTISASQYADAEEKERIKEEQAAAQEKEDVKKAESKKVKPQETRSIEKREDKRDYEALQKKKIQQKGGDKKKTHRRKSIG